jgi:hypothetical protein
MAAPGIDAEASPSSCVEIRRSAARAIPDGGDGNTPDAER